jgi:G3E family GTPase
MIGSSATKVPVTILTGYLGSGKTTLLNHLLASKLGADTAVIVNEFGAISIDAELLVGIDEEILQINNGCICCTVRSDLVSTISKLIAGSRPINRIIVETSGLADPAPIIQSFILDEVLFEFTQLDAIVTVVDACHIDRWLADVSGEENLAAEQIAFADIAVISKTDIVDADALCRSENQVRALNPLARIVHAANGTVDPQTILDVKAFDLQNSLAIEPLLLSDLEHEHDSSIGSVEVRLDTALDGERFFRWLNAFVQQKAASLLRTKGVISLADEARRWVFHGVHMTLEGRPGRPWGTNEARTSSMVFIGRGLNGAEIRAAVEKNAKSPVHATQ